MDLHVFLYDGIVRDKDPADRDAASDVGCYFTVGDQTFTSDILLNTNEPNFRCLPRPEPPRRCEQGARPDLRVAPYHPARAAEQPSPM